MKRLLAVVVLMAAPLLLLAQTAPSAGNLQTPAKPARAQTDEFLYGRFFAQVVAINKQADEADRLGMNSRYFRTYFQVKAQLNPNEVTLLNQITADLAAQMAQYDAKAKEVRDQFHVQLERARAANALLPEHLRFIPHSHIPPIRELHYPPNGRNGTFGTSCSRLNAHRAAPFQRFSPTHS